MKLHEATYTIPSGYGTEDEYRAEITEQASGDCTVELYRIYPDREYKRTPSGGVKKPSLKSAKQFVRDQLPRYTDTRLKWTEKAVEETLCK